MDFTAGKVFKTLDELHREPEFYRLLFAEALEFVAGRFVFAAGLFLSAGAAFELAAFVFAGAEFESDGAGFAFAAAAGRAPLSSFGLSTTFFARKFSMSASFIAIA